MINYVLKYKTFDKLLSEVHGDFTAFRTEDIIKPEQLIKVAKLVTAKLGLRIYQTKNAVLEVEHGKAKLPVDFHVLNYMFVLGNYEVISPVIQGTHVEEVPLLAPEYHPGTNTIDTCATPNPCPIVTPCPDPCANPKPCGCDTCNTGCSTWLNCKGEEMHLIQKIKYETRKWTELHRIRLVGDDQFYDPLCPNKQWQASNTAFIRDGYIYTSFKTGNLHLNYEGMMEDAEGNLLVLDHDIINEYYEYALKDRILENLLANQETLTAAFIQRIERKLIESRNNAMSIVNTPNFSELKGVWAINRKAMFNKYYKMFT